jgi:hypothetical protein
MAYRCFHAVSITVGEDAAAALDAALATATRQLDEQIRGEAFDPAAVRLSGISHSHTMTSNGSGQFCAQVSVIVGCEYR